MKKFLIAWLVVVAGMFTTIAFGHLVIAAYRYLATIVSVQTLVDGTALFLISIIITITWYIFPGRVK